MIPPIYSFFNRIPTDKKEGRIISLKKRICRLCTISLCMYGTGFHFVSADELVRYDFENTNATGTRPQRSWIISDQATPPATDALVEEINGQRITTYEKGNALELFATPKNAAISLDQGANHELKGNFSSGLVLEATFHIKKFLDKTSQVLFARYGTEAHNRTFSLMIQSGSEENPSDNNRTVQFMIYPKSGENPEILHSNIRITEGQTYHIRAIFNPFTGIMNMEISGFETDSVQKYIFITELQESDVPLYIGGRLNDGRVNRFFGYIDNILIATAPNP